MTSWDRELIAILSKNESAILTTIIHVLGSAPRNPGTKMIVTENCIKGTIGGGNFEFMIIDQCRKLLLNDDKKVMVQHYPLGPLTRQCCGGRVSILLEKFTPNMVSEVEIIHAARQQDHAKSMVSDVNQNRVLKQVTSNNSSSITLYDGEMAIRTDKPISWNSENIIRFVEPLQDHKAPLYIFGAGHVGRALIAILDNLPFQVTWIDSRSSEFPQSIPESVKVCVSEKPLDYVDSAPANAFYLVFTHSHDLDFQITAKILTRGDSRYCGLIASDTKRARFISRFTKDLKIPESKQKKLTSPIGLPNIKGKDPSTIAISVCAQLLAKLEAAE